MTALRTLKPGNHESGIAAVETVSVPVGPFDYDLIAHDGPIRCGRKLVPMLTDTDTMSITIDVSLPAPKRWRTFWRGVAWASHYDLNITEQPLSGETLANLGPLMFYRLTDGVMERVEDFLSLPPAMRRCNAHRDGDMLLIPVAGSYYNLSIEPKISFEGKEVNGLINTSHYTIQLDSALPPRNRWSTFAHELMHVLDMDISEDGQALDENQLAHLIPLAFQPYNAATIRAIREYLETA